MKIECVDYETGGYGISKFKTMRGHDGDGTAYQCDLMFNGKVVAGILDDGWGGGLQYFWKSKEAETAFNKHITTLPQWFADGKPMDTDNDIFIDHLVSLYDFKRKVKRLCKTKIVLTFEGDKQFSYRVVDMPYTPELVAKLKVKYPNIKTVWNEEE